MAAAVSFDVIGETALSGVEAGAFWLFPDPVSHALIEARHAEMISGLG